MPAEATLSAQGGNRFALGGDVGFESVPALLARGSSEFAAHREVELDLAGVTDADSAALALLLEWTREARQAGRRIRLRAVPERLLEIARISGVDQLLERA